MPSSELNSVVIVTPGFPKDEEDTTCLPFVQQLVLSLKCNFPHIVFTVISFQYPFKRGTYIWNGISVHAIGGKNRKHLFALNTRRLALQKLRELDLEYDIKGIISLWCIDTAMVSNKFSLRNNIRHMIWIPGQDARETNGFVKRIKPAPGQLMAISDFVKREFKKNHQIEPQHVITNGINPGAFGPLNTGRRPIDILGAGSLIPLKNYTLFIEVISELVKFFPGLIVKIAGDGPEKALLETLIHNSHLEDRIELLGKLSHRETLELMNRSTFFLHTSNYEGNSTVLMEALYSGCKVVTTQGLSDTEIKNLFVRHNLRGLADCLSSLLKNQAAAERILFNATENSAKKMMELFL